MEEEQSLSIGEIFRVIFKRVWWVVGSTALGLILVVLLMHFWYNKNHELYTVDYEIVTPDSSRGTYPDGTQMLYADSISLQTLTDVVEGVYSADGEKEDLKGIDVAKMLQNDDITISESVTQAADGSVKRNYKLSASAKYFKNDEQAMKFMRTVAKYPVNHAVTMVETGEYGLYFTLYNHADSYEEQIAALNTQKTYIKDVYESLKAVGGNEVNLKLAELDTVFTTAQQKELTDEITTNLYVLDTETYKLNAGATKAALKKQKYDNQNIIDDLIAKRDRQQGTPATLAANTSGEETTIINSYDAKIAELVVENGKLQNQIDDIDKTLTAIETYTNAENKEAHDAYGAFNKKLDDYKAKLEKATAELKEISKDIYTKNSRVLFAGNKITVEGGISTILSAVIGAVVGFAICALVICIIDLPKYKRAKLAAATGSVEGEKKIDSPEQQIEEMSAEAPATSAAPAEAQTQAPAEAPAVSDTPEQPAEEEVTDKEKKENKKQAKKEKGIKN